MTITYDLTVDALSAHKRAGKYYETLPLHLEGVDLNLDLDEDGNILKLEVLAASHLLELVARHGGELVIPDRINDPDNFNALELFPRVPAHA
ncbi:MAG: DUF2283 domain-containing protein [Deinococcota bacterium]|jgi:uncharacterized protein YuzE|nr:DUF2283 domain-containing protein [Deinococcota bacterium]